MKDIFRILIFTLIYYFLTNESIFKVALIFITTLILLIILDFFQKKKCSFQYLLIVSFLLLIPLTLRNEIQSIFLPVGYQYIYISLISSLIYIDSKKINLKVSLRKRLYDSFIAAIAPGSYLSGPSATFQEINNIKNNSFGLTRLESIKFSNIKLAVSGGLRISLGFYLNTLSPNILNKYFLLNESSIIYKFLILIIFGFFNFWRYYLLFSGASEISKSFLSLFEIKVIDNFKNPEIAVFYHEIWAKWHLNITQRIKDFLYTPLTLFAFRNFNLTNNKVKFFIIEGLPVAILFLVLSLWHGGKLSDFIFAVLSTIFTLISRALSQNPLFKQKLIQISFFKEVIRFISLSLFGIVLGIYSLNNQFQDYQIENLSDIIQPLLISFLIYFYYRFKINLDIFKEKFLKYKSLDIYIFFYEAIMLIYINLFLIIDLKEINNFIYFAN